MGLDKITSTCYNPSQINMKKYELTYLVSPELSESGLQEIQGEVESFITDNKGEVLSLKIDPTKRDLGSEIKGKKNARMTALIFTLEPVHIAGLKKIVKEKSELLRHLLVNKPKIKPDKKRGEKKSNIERKMPDKVELKEIDKKIEELLSE